MLTHKRLRELLKYDPATGVFTWQVNRRGSARKGMQAGFSNNDGYRRIIIDGRPFLSGRLAIFWMTGQWPEGDTDHRNGIRDDDRWRNLRTATRSQNNINRPDTKGFTWDKQTQRYLAQIRVNYKNVFLGRFDTAEEARLAYVNAAQKYYGQFARVV